MRPIVKRSALLVMAACLLAGPPFMATTLVQMNLGDLSQRADKIFRGTVLDVTEGTVNLGGVDVPTYKYVVRVDEAFKGEFSDEKGVPVAEIQTIGKMKPVEIGQARLVPALPDVPRFEVGTEYLLFTTPASDLGLSAPVGLGQGCFHLYGKPGEEEAVNEFGNRGLFDGMPGVEGLDSGRPVRYSELARQIRASLGQE